MTCALGFWMLFGLVVDGWAHVNRDLTDSLLTPWHAIFYSGWIALALWMTSRVRVRWRDGRRGISAIPVGYAMGMFGIALFLVSGVGDQLWHLAWGVEQDLEAFLSPTHYGLAIGMFLMLSSPLRAAWSSDMPRVVQSVKGFLPALFSVTLTLGVAGLAYWYLSAFTSALPRTVDADFFASFPPDSSGALLDRVADELLAAGIGKFLVTSVILTASMLFCLRRWKLPFGAVTFFFTIYGIEMLTFVQFRQGWTLLAAVFGGLAADILIARLPSSPQPHHFWSIGLLVPAATWAAFFAIMFAFYSVGWPPEIWSGIVVLTALNGGLLATLVFSPRGGDREPLAATQA